MAACLDHQGVALVLPELVLIDDVGQQPCAEGQDQNNPRPKASDMGLPGRAARFATSG